MRIGVATDANFRDLDIAAAGPVVRDISDVFGRVEMWCGGLRHGPSVASPFVWRCLHDRSDRFRPEWSPGGHPLENAAFAGRTPIRFIRHIQVNGRLTLNGYTGTTCDLYQTNQHDSATNIANHQLESDAFDYLS